MRKASIKETGEELSQAEWARFDAAVARAKAERADQGPLQKELFEDQRHEAGSRVPHDGRRTPYHAALGAS